MPRMATRWVQAAEVERVKADIVSERGGVACGKVTQRAVQPSENGVSRAKSRATCGEALRDPSIPGSRCPVSHGARDETPVRLSFPAKSRGGRGMRTGREWGRADFFRFFRDFSRDRTAAHLSLIHI